MKRSRAGRGYALDVIKRKREMLQMLPRLPLKLTAREMTARLAAKGFDVTKRSVERDLVALEGEGFGIVYDDGHPRGWSYGHRAPAQLLGLDLNTALTLKLAYVYVRQLVPATLLNDLATLVNAADKSLKGIRNNLLAGWPDKIRVIGTGPARKPPDIVAKVHLAVSEALLKNLQLRVQYSSIARGRAAEYLVSPLGMVLKGGIIYVVVSREDKPTPFTLSLHRIRDARLEHIATKAPAGWTGLDAHIDAGNFLFPPGPVEKGCQVTLRFDSMVAQNIREMPLGEEQTIEQETTLAPDGKPYYLVRARLTVSEEFMRWLLQFGDHVEVIKPNSLRKRMRGLVARLHTAYTTA